MARLGGCGGALSLVLVVPFLEGNAGLLFSLGTEFCARPVERCGSPGSWALEASRWAAVSVMVLEVLLAGEAGAVRCAGFLATGGGPLGFEGCCGCRDAELTDGAGEGTSFFRGCWYVAAAGGVPFTEPVCRRGGGGGGGPSP